VVADGRGDECKEDVNIHDVGSNSGGRLKRMTSVVRSIFDKALQIDGDLYHLHDPELMPIGVKLMRQGKKVIFDAHEDLPKQMRSKPYLNRFSRKILPQAASVYEKWACSKFSAVICATPSITKKFSAINQVSETINNFPILGELIDSDGHELRSREVTYVGGMSRQRGIEYLVAAMGFTTDVKLNLIGEFEDAAFEREVEQEHTFSRVNLLGFLERSEVRDVLARSCAGVVTFLASPNHIDAQPNKMFEYMSAGVPIITSNFPLWREIVEGNKCGVCVEPTDAAAIGAAIQYLADNPSEALEMGQRGLRAIVDKYNWSNEEMKLLALYSQVLG
jgi:glycosyltransferase involved in cell wall biosynthesis